ncbi:MAG TPA: DUF389 domain-containing protein, partial [Acidimicrobiales bacterium]
IVAPLMVPIMGTVLAVSLGDRPNLIRSLGLVVSGAACAIAVGYAFGLFIAVDVVAATSGQVAGRVNPRLIDLIAAIATGAAGAFAQCRSDVSDTLPGVAIAISLVPPLAVVGLTLEAGATSEAWGAMLLFLTNVAAILLTGIIVMGIYKVHGRARVESGRPVNRRNFILLIIAVVIVIALPLAATSVSLTLDTRREATVASVARAWARPAGWTVIRVDRLDRNVTVVAIGPAPSPDPADLRTALDDEGLEELDVTVRLIPEQRVVLEGTG